MEKLALCQMAQMPQSPIQCCGCLTANDSPMLSDQILPLTYLSVWLSRAGRAVCQCQRSRLLPDGLSAHLMPYPHSPRWLTPVPHSDQKKRGKRTHEGQLHFILRTRPGNFTLHYCRYRMSQN